MVFITMTVEYARERKEEYMKSKPIQLFQLSYEKINVISKQGYLNDIQIRK
jgi:hypothetical protein